jgi:hypothetical protein
MPLRSWLLLALLACCSPRNCCVAQFLGTGVLRDGAQPAAAERVAVPRAQRGGVQRGAPAAAPRVIVATTRAAQRGGGAPAAQQNSALSAAAAAGTCTLSTWCVSARSLP